MSLSSDPGSNHQESKANNRKSSSIRNLLSILAAPLSAPPVANNNKLDSLPLHMRHQRPQRQRRHTHATAPRQSMLESDHVFTTLREASRKKSAVVIQGNRAKLYQRSMSIPNHNNNNRKHGCHTNLIRSRSLIYNNNSNDSEYNVRCFLILVVGNETHQSVNLCIH